LKGSIFFLESNSGDCNNLFEIVCSQSALRIGGEENAISSMGFRVHNDPGSCRDGYVSNSGATRTASSTYDHDDRGFR
jgi:hypothetical protein